MKNQLVFILIVLVSIYQTSCVKQANTETSSSWSDLVQIAKPEKDILETWKSVWKQSR